MRLNKIYTKTGDAGETHLAKGERVKKHSLRIHVTGEVDELNAHIGILLAETLSDWQRNILSQLQNRLFDLGAELSLVDVEYIDASDVAEMELAIDEMNGKLQPLKEFILPAGSRSVALCHLARTVCRRAERSMWALNEQQALNKYALQYVNRLSDFLFVLARDIARNDGVAEVCWQAKAKEPDRK